MSVPPFYYTQHVSDREEKEERREKEKRKRNGYVPCKFYHLKRARRGEGREGRHEWERKREGGNRRTLIVRTVCLSI